MERCAYLSRCAHLEHIKIFSMIFLTSVSYGCKNVLQWKQNDGNVEVTIQKVHKKYLYHKAIIHPKMELDELSVATVSMKNEVQKETVHSFYILSSFH